MKKILSIFVLIFISCNTVYASNPNIRLDYPEKIYSYKEFNINLFLENFPRDLYDIKIEIFNDSFNDSERIAKIWNNDNWQSTYYYIKDAINTSENFEKTFKLKITKCYKGRADFKIKIKNSKNKVYTFYNYPINIIADCEENIDIKNETYNSTKSKENFLSNREEIFYKIPSKIKNSKNKVLYKSKNELIREYSIFVFIILILFIMIIQTKNN